MTTEKTIALATWTFVGKVMSLLFNTLSRFVMAFLPRRKHLMASSHLNHIIRDSVSKYSLMGIRASTYESGGREHKHSGHNTILFPIVAK